MLNPFSCVDLHKCFTFNMQMFLTSQNTKNEMLYSMNITYWTVITQTMFCHGQISSLGNVSKKRKYLLKSFSCIICTPELKTLYPIYVICLWYLFGLECCTMSAMRDLTLPSSIEKD